MAVTLHYKATSPLFCVLSVAQKNGAHEARVSAVARGWERSRDEPWATRLPEMLGWLG